jgi:hypothetical protein
VDYVFWYNVLEAGLWAGFGLLTGVFGGRVRGMTARLRAVFVVSFLAFGVSDAIEAHTGAWWKPPGLLVFKGACLASLAAGGWVLWRRRKLL